MINMENNNFITIKERPVNFDNQRIEYLIVKGYPRDKAIKYGTNFGNTSFKIKHKDDKIPVMHFLTEEDMMTVYNLLKSNHMRFEGE